QAIGISPQSVAVAVTHTHAGPLTTRDYYPEGKAVRHAYMQFIREQAVKAVLRAKEGSEPVVVGAGYGTCHIGKNRRQLLDNGIMITGYNESGDTDPTVGVLRFDRANGETLASIVQYACHPTTLGAANRLLSPDYPGVTKRIVEQTVGGTCLFLQGAAGDIGPGPEGFGNHYAAVKRMGTILGCEASKVLLQSKADEQKFRFDQVVESGASLGMWVSDPKIREEVCLQVRSEVIRLPLREQIPVEEAERSYDECRLALERLQKNGGDAEEIRQAGFKAKRAGLALERSRQFYGSLETDIELHVIRCGEVVMIGVPLEPFSAIGKNIREASPFAYTFFGGYTNGWLGYLPMPEDFPAGGYEVETTPFAPEAAERLIEGVVRLLREMK
ncbi:MAG: hypothetical protein K0R28_681, partial [Paenibacillus sp.]|nr:hypothetical protein [Paenibacillus sp.]